MGFLINFSDVRTLGNQNLAINGNFDFWQRGNTAVSGQAYRADRFISSAGTEAYSRGSATPPVGSEFYAIISRTTATPSTLFLAQRVESFIARSMQGKTVTLSFKMRQVAGTLTQAAVSVQSANVRDTFSAVTQQVTQTDLGILSANWQDFKISFVVNTVMATNGFEIRMGRSSVTGPVTYEIAQVKLEEGVEATAFSLFTASYQDELMACQRYYQFLENCVCYGALNVSNYFAFKVTMRVPPVCAVTPLQNTNAAGVTQTSNSLTQHGVVYQADVPVNGVTYNRFNLVADAEL
jgi:hypothetical protein